MHEVLSPVPAGGPSSSFVIGVILYVALHNNLIRAPEILTAAPFLLEILWNSSFSALAVTGPCAYHSQTKPSLLFWSPLRIAKSVENAFTPGFFLSTLEDIWLDRQLSDPTDVLVDRKGRVFLETKWYIGALATSGGRIASSLVFKWLYHVSPSCF